MNNHILEAAKALGLNYCSDHNLFYSPAQLCQGCSEKQKAAQLEARVARVAQLEALVARLEEYVVARFAAFHTALNHVSVRADRIGEQADHLDEAQTCHESELLDQGAAIEEMRELLGYPPSQRHPRERVELDFADLGFGATQFYEVKFDPPITVECGGTLVTNITFTLP